MGPGKLMYPLSANANVLSATLRFSQKYVHPYYDVSMGVMLAYYQQGGGVMESTLALAESGYIDLP
jgi:hypothetical protein